MPDETQPAIELELSPGKVDAIHRALLTGLLSNVGTRAQGSEYEGARGIKFHLFPGSGLFKSRPNWVVAAELVHTNRLYARTVGKIQPQWIERLGGHLLKRTYQEPFWHRPSAHVLAYEKVLLYGLVIVEKRRVHFGPVEPRLARDMFIDHALVAGEYTTAAPFFAHNQQMIQAVRTLEAKARRNDLLVDERKRFAFYDARIPQGIYDGPSFEKWRRQAERGNPRLLYFSMDDLLTQDVSDITPQRYPDQITVARIPLPLSYAYEPGPTDGVTATVPLAALNQIPEEPFEWLVPGYLEEKITALIRSLPKAIRVQFVPVPQYAKEAAEKLTFGEGSLTAALARFLGKKAGQIIPPGAFNTDALPDWMKFNFRVIDAAGKPIAMGRDLSALRRELKLEARATFAAGMGHGPYHRDNVTRWDFGDLPERIPVERDGMMLYGYPALVDMGNGVALRVLDSPEAADEALRRGVRKLLMVQLRHEMRDLSRSITGLDRMCLHYAPLGSGEQLREQIVTATADRALLLNSGQVIRTQAEFVRRAEEAWKRLAPVAREVEQLTRQIMENYHEVARQLQEDAPPAWLPSVVDMRRQLALLMPKDFLLSTPPQWLGHLPRFLKAIDVRLKKLKNAGLNRDLANLAIIEPFTAQYRDAAVRHSKLGTVDPELTTFRWMLEELRVSLFAQELKTSIPISPQRLQKQWERVSV